MVDLTNLKEAVIPSALLFLSCFIKIPKLEINIWSWLGRKLGDVLNANQKKEMDEIRSEIHKLNSTFEEHKQQDIVREMDHKRQRILRFSDEIRRKTRHSKESFDNVLEEIDAYEKYCDIHPEYKNNKAKFAVINIKKVYEKTLENNDFLED